MTPYSITSLDNMLSSINGLHMPAVLQASQGSTSNDLQEIEEELGLTSWSPRQEVVESLPYFDEWMDITVFGTDSYVDDVVQGQEIQRASPPPIPDAPSHELGVEFLNSLQNLDDSPHGEAPLPCLAPGNGLRGADVQEHPDLSKMALDGAKQHWAKRVAALRAECKARYWRLPTDMTNKFEAQIRAAHVKVKAQKECVLRFLQLAADDGVVLPALAGVDAGFFGWVGFEAAPGRARELRAGVEGLFPAGFKETRLEHAFRQVGLVPKGNQWRRGWEGAVAFEFRPAAA